MYNYFRNKVEENGREAKKYGWNKKLFNWSNKSKWIDESKAQKGL